ncbi:hypothetical protein bmyco0003_32180 [Bacillus pseudomycoides]|nr:hypothetical protein bmyco0003_32180 [Bacillus pseudomycoides]
MLPHCHQAKKTKTYISLSLGGGERLFDKLERLFKKDKENDFEDERYIFKQNR